MLKLNLNPENRRTTGLKTRMTLLLTPLLLLGTFGSVHAGAQYRDQDRDHHHDNFYNGARNGSRGGYYDRGYDRRDDPRYHQGGIGPGKGALIGGAGGAALGAIFGGGAKGALIGGAAGAGIGAIAGKVHQDNKRDQYYYPR